MHDKENRAKHTVLCHSVSSQITLTTPRLGAEEGVGRTKKKKKKNRTSNSPEREAAGGGTADSLLEHPPSRPESRTTPIEEEPQQRAEMEAVQLSLGSEARQRQPLPGSAERHRLASPSATVHRQQGAGYG